MSGPHGTDSVTCSTVSGSVACSKWVQVGQVLRELTAEPDVGPDLAYGLARRVLVVGPAERELRVAGPVATGALELLEELAVGRRAPVAVADAPADLGRRRAEPRHDDGDGGLRRIEQAGVLDLVVARRGGRRSPQSTARGRRRSLPRASRGGLRAAASASPVMCSLSASPVPTPQKKRPPKSSDVVAVAWARIAGCTLTIGHVTPTPTSTRSVAWATAPSTAQTNGLWPCDVGPGMVVVRDREEVETQLFRT